MTNIVNDTGEPGLPVPPEGPQPDVNDATGPAAVPESEADLVAENISLRDQLAAVTAENDQLKAQLKHAEEAAKVGRKSAAPKARKIGPVKNPIDPDELGERLAEGEWEIGFSDGKNEILGLDPVTVQGAAAWVQRERRWMLRERVLLHGPAAGQQPFTVAGFGLFDPDGKQVAWGALFDPVRVAAGGQTELRDTILF